MLPTFDFNTLLSKQDDPQFLESNLNALRQLLELQTKVYGSTTTNAIVKECYNQDAMIIGRACKLAWEQQQKKK